jgi:hypothetical protein
MWLIVSIAVGTLLATLLLAYFLKSRLSDKDVWEDLVDTNASPADSSPVLLPRATYSSFGRTGQIQNSNVQTMTTVPSTQSSRSTRDVELRRSSRVERPVTLMVLGTDRRGEPFKEMTSVVSLNLHGCRYSSRHEYSPEGWVMLQVTGTDGASAPAVRARVKSIYSPQTPRELCQVGVELETPGNVWGIPVPPEDWQHILSPTNVAADNAAASPAIATPVSEHTSRLLSSDLETHSLSSERKSEVAMFPGPAAPPPAAAAPASTEAAAKPERIVLTPEKLLQALQGRLQQAADRAAESAVATRLDDAATAALGKLDDAWKANLRQIEEFSAARLVEVQNRWERELVVYRSRAEEIARRLEALSANTQQNLADSQKLLEHLANDIEPQLHARLDQAFSHAHSEFESRTAQLSSEHLARLAEFSQAAERDARSRFEEAVAEVRSLLDSAPANVSEEHLQALLISSREYALNHTEERLGETWRQFEEQQDLARNRTDEIARQLQALSDELHQVQTRNDQTAAEIRSLLAAANTGVSPEQLDSRLSSTRTQFHDLLEWRLGEVSAQFAKLQEGANQRSEEIAQRLESFATDARAQLDETRRLAEREPRATRQFDLAVVEQSVDHASREFETSAARISDRQLVRLMEQKQVLAHEISLELEARASEARSLLQKAANTTLEDFRHRVEVQIDLAVTEATERIVSALSTLDAESRANCEARHRALEADIARAAEQSTAEFRTGMKAFLYSCLVAAVSAVDEHAQNTMTGLANEPAGATHTLEAPAAAPEQPETRSSAASASSSSSPQDSLT